MSEAEGAPPPDKGTADAAEVAPASTDAPAADEEPAAAQAAAHEGEEAEGVPAGAGEEAAAEAGEDAAAGAAVDAGEEAAAAGGGEAAAEAEGEAAPPAGGEGDAPPADAAEAAEAAETAPAEAEGEAAADAAGADAPAEGEGQEGAPSPAATAEEGAPPAAVAGEAGVEGAAQPPGGEAGAGAEEGAAPADDEPAAPGEGAREEEAAIPAREAPPTTSAAGAGEAEGSPPAGGEETGVEIASRTEATPSPDVEGSKDAAVSRRESPEGDIIVEEGEQKEGDETAMDGPTLEELAAERWEKEQMQEFEEKIRELQEEFTKISADNIQLHRKVIQNRVQKDKSEADKGPGDSMRVTEHKYLAVLQHVHAARLKLRQQQIKAAKMSEELKNQLEEKREKAVECRDAFRDFKRQVSSNAEYTRTGKNIPPKILREIENFELDKDAEVEEVRGSNISLKNRLAKLEMQLRKKDELADNLHVIDFEQLKIENQTLNEKIEERNEELHKLKKKTVITVQVMTHMREKLQCIVQENHVLKTQLTQLDQELGGQRDLVAKTKHERDDFRVENTKFKQQAGLINSRVLNEDYETRTKRINEIKNNIERLRDTYNEKWCYIKSTQEHVGA